MKRNKCSLTTKRGDFNGVKSIKIIFLFIIILASAGLAQSAAVNVTLNYVWNGSEWIPWLSTADGKPKVNLNLLNISAGDMTATGSITAGKNLTVDTGTLLVDSGNNRVGIRTLAPLSILDISQNVTTSTNIDHNDTAFTDGFAWNMTSLNVTSVSGFPGAGTLIIDSEAIIYTGVDTALNTFTGLTRGALSTTAANHTNNTAVYYLIFSVTRNQSLAPRMVLISDGRVGIGTAVPNQVLTVNGSINATGNITSGTGTIIIDGTNNRIGIGTMTPTQALTIVGSINVTGTSYLGSMTLESGNITAAKGLFTNLNVTGTSYLGDITIHADNLTLTDLIAKNENISFFNATKNEQMRITYNGLVGIGIKAPTEKLHVSGNGTFTSSLFLGGDLVASGIAGGAEATSAGWVDDGTVVRLASSTDSVGIGTTTPTGRLEVVADDTGPQRQTALNITSAGLSVMTVGDGASGDEEGLIKVYDDGIQTVQIFAGTGNSYFNGDGNVGIGTTAPKEKLVVVGGVNITNGANISNGLNVITGNVGINETAPDALLTIKQGNIGDTFTIKSSSVSHTFTGNWEADTYVTFSPTESGSGGAQLTGIKDADGTAGGAVRLAGKLSEAADTTKSTAGRAITEIVSSITDGAVGGTTPGADQNLLAVIAHGTTRFIFDAEGTGHADDVWADNAWDLAEEYDVSEDVEEGTVLTVDNNHNNRMSPTTSPYQIITGVVSYHTAQLKNTFNNLPEKYPQLNVHNYTRPTSVGITGLVPTKATNQNGNIAIGDILVSSSKKGFAMKVDEDKKMTINRAFMVGIALMPCSEEECIINIQR